MTRLSTVLLASLPSTLAAMLAYTPTDEMRTMAASRADCNLPGYYNINNFLAQSNDTGRTLSAFDFGFANNETQVTTLCHFNASSDTTTPPGATPRYFCEDKNVLFIWENEDQQLWMIQQVCPGSSGTPTYEASGSILLDISCKPGTQDCATNSTSLTSKFTSIGPVRAPPS